MPDAARGSVSWATSATGRLEDAAAGPACTARPDEATVVVRSREFQAWQAGHWPCHCGVRAPQEPHT